MLQNILHKGWHLCLNKIPCTTKANLLHYARPQSLPQHTLLRAFRNTAKNRYQQRSSGLQMTPQDIINSGPVPVGNVMKALIFTGSFTIGSFLGATILEYENTRNMMINKARQAKYAWLRRLEIGNQTSWENLKREFNQLWERLTPGEKMFVPICALNLIIFGLWRVQSMRKTMMTYFCSNPIGRAVCWPMFLSTFSHYSTFHIFANMYVLYSFSNAAVMTLGKEQFLAVYLSAGVIASMGSILYKAITSQPGLSIGASGAIMGILAYVCSLYPDTQLSVLFLPMFTFSAGSAIKVLMGVDLVGCIMGWKFFDHAAHLGGALFGVLWAYFGTELWQKRIPFLTMYHDWRKTKT